MHCTSSEAARTGEQLRTGTRRSGRYGKMNPINEQARTTRRLTERGRIGIFNRSYYEEVLIVRVHPEILRGQGLPEELLDEKTIRKEPYRSIVDLEDHQIIESFRCY